MASSTNAKKHTRINLERTRALEYLGSTELAEVGAGRKTPGYT
jgi:hypothetical protein